MYLRTFVAIINYLRCAHCNVMQVKHQARMIMACRGKRLYNCDWIITLLHWWGSPLRQKRCPPIIRQGDRWLRSWSRGTHNQDNVEAKNLKIHSEPHLTKVKSRYAKPEVDSVLLKDSHRILSTQAGFSSTYDNCMRKHTGCQKNTFLEFLENKPIKFPSSSLVQFDK